MAASPVDASDEAVGAEFVEALPLDADESSDTEMFAV